MKDTPLLKEIRKRYRIEIERRRKKPSNQLNSNPRPQDYEACALLLCYNCSQGTEIDFFSTEANRISFAFFNPRSWQQITFPRRPVVFIRIVGTHNTANEVFHCVHLECPAVNHANADDDDNQVGLASKETDVPTSPQPIAGDDELAAAQNVADEVMVCDG